MKLNMEQLAIDLIGWIGSVMVILAYGLIRYHRVTAQSKGYQVLNFIGAAFLMANTYYYGAFPSTIVNVVWLFIALGALSKMVRKSFPKADPNL